MVGNRPATLVTIIVGAWLAGFSLAFAEKINNFESVIELNADGTFIVTETIEYDFEGLQRHGIYRNVSNDQAQPATAWYKDRYIELELVSVKRNGLNEPYELERYDGLSVRIGDADRYVSGLQTYEIVYKVDGAISVFPEYQELYWNVTGNEWQVPILTSTAEVVLDQSWRLPERACYVGPEGSDQQCQNILDLSPEEVIFSTDQLSSGTGLTIAQRVSLPEPPKVVERIRIILLWPIIIIAWFGGLITWVYRWKTKYKSDAPVVAQYEPLPDFKPMYTGVLFDNQLDPRDITAGIVYLAQQGFIKITKTTDKVLLLFEVDDYEVTLLRPIEDADTRFDRSLLYLLFELHDEPEVTARLSKLKSDTKRTQRNALAVSELHRDITKDLKVLGYFEGNHKYVFPVAVVLGVIMLYGLQVIGGVLEYVAPFYIIAGASVVILLFAFGRRTKKGHEALLYLKGFKEFLSVTEKDRYEFHEAPKKSPKQFMEFLPYAIAFGVEDKWAEVFKDIAIDPPTWYDSNGTVSTFNAASFSHNIGQFANSFIAANASRSSSGGSGGGGFSGGGSGGGGGGSW